CDKALFPSLHHRSTTARRGIRTHVSLPRHTPRTKLEVEGIDAIAIDQEFPKMSKLQTWALARVRDQESRVAVEAKEESLALICVDSG
ncbi:MAG: hypothetical protein DMG12_23400, partial [Acidobacteria bacterium]